MRQMILIITSFSILLVSDLFAQGRIYEGPDDPAGDIAAERAGWMNGNRVLLFFRNTGETSDHIHGVMSSKWPNTLDGYKMHDGTTPMIGARIYIENDSIGRRRRYQRLSGKDSGIAKPDQRDLLTCS